MAAIILTVLKYAGIAVVIIIAVALFLIASLLFIPVRYRVKGSLGEEVPDGNIRLTWFFRLLRLDLRYDKDELVIGKLRILGIPVYSFGESYSGKEARDEKK